MTPAALKTALAGVLALLLVTAGGVWKVQDWRYGKQLAEQSGARQADLTAISNAAADQVRTALEKQFRLKVGALKKRSFTAQTRAKDRKPAGRQWTFEVSEQENTAQSKQGAAPVKRVVFWIVDQGSTRSILRASVSTPRDEARAEQLAQALNW